MTYIYLDVLIITNVYVNYFLLRATSRISHTALNFRRCALACLVGSFTSLTILLPEMNIFLNFILKFGMSFFIVKIAFSKLKIERYIKLDILFCVISFVFAGFISMVCELFNFSLIVVSNSTIYFNISLLALGLSTAIAYAIVCAVTYILDRKCNINHAFKVKINLFGDDFELDAVADTGNLLVDTFSGKPVIVCNSNKLSEMASLENRKEYSATDYLSKMKNFKGLRFLPYKTIGNSGIIPAFSADMVTVKNENDEEKPVDVLIALSTNSMSEEKAIFNPRILI